ncbi:Alpha-L-arabinofuranosidase 2 [Camellia lanceoleosa]|uniref:Alpha-L-arabinofuranosidase 2 n=1 Tax=Camellia lanceoleosa TaxID=1840588 RepID=A0ACC0G9M8_9ERIC|nr:Alpha-L-arabinofuranosidase 2 [Camellia lanceoleosa]
MGRVELLLVANDTNHNSRLQLTRSKKGVIWFDQVSAMPLDTFKSLHCFWKVKAGGNRWGYIVFTSR